MESRGASFTNALSCPHIAASVTVAAVASVSTIWAPVASVTGSPAVLPSPARSTATSPCHRVTVPVIPTATSHLAAQPKPASWTHILAATANISRWTQAGTRGRVTAGVVLTLQADLLAAHSPAASGASSATVKSCSTRQTDALPSEPVAGGAATGTGL